MIIATAAVCLGMDAITFTAMNIAKPYVARMTDKVKLGVASQHITDAAVRRVNALRVAARVYRDTVQS